MLPAGLRRQPKARLPVAIQAGCIPTNFPAILSLHRDSAGRCDNENANQLRQSGLRHTSRGSSGHRILPFSISGTWCRRRSTGAFTFLVETPPAHTSPPASPPTPARSEVALEELSREPAVAIHTQFELADTVHKSARVIAGAVAEPGSRARALLGPEGIGHLDFQHHPASPRERSRVAHQGSSTKAR